MSLKKLRAGGTKTRQFQKERIIIGGEERLM